MTQKANSARVKMAWQDPVMLQIGKGGMTEGIITEAKRLLKKHRYIKVRLLRSVGADKHIKKDVFRELCNLTGAHLAGVRGNTAVIYKERNK